MKSKAFILHQIGELLDKNRGMCEDEIVQWKEDNKDKTVYELLVIKKVNVKNDGLECIPKD